MCYDNEDLSEIYRVYAELKGWTTDSETVAAKVKAWTEQSIGAVGLAVDFYETGSDFYKQRGYDAEERLAAILAFGGPVAVEVMRFFPFLKRPPTEPPPTSR